MKILNLLLLLILIFNVQTEAQTTASTMYEAAEIPTYNKYKETVPIRLYLPKGNELLVIKTNKESIVFQKFNIETLKNITQKWMKRKTCFSTLSTLF